MKLVVIGDCFIDIDVDGRVHRLSPEAPVPVVEGITSLVRPGGAGLAAAIAARSGCGTTLVGAQADDHAGRHLASLLHAAGIHTAPLATTSSIEQKTRIRADGRTLLRVDSGAGSCASTTLEAPLGDHARDALLEADAVLVADYGRGVAAHRELRELLDGIAGRCPIVWDPHPRGAPPTTGAWAVTPNYVEALDAVGRAPSRSLRDIHDTARVLRERWRSRSVVVTLDRRGVLCETGLGPPLVVPIEEPVDGDACGAGDAFAVALTRALGHRLVLSEAVVAAVDAAGRFLRAGGAPSLGIEERGPAMRVLMPVPEPAATTPRVIAAGGCFDVLHVGHIQLLEQARRLGDRLVVLLNGDESVRALKGAPRPIVPAVERARVLAALGCVDEVRIFHETTTDSALRELRPDVFVKGGDYATGPVAEQAVLDEWGGQAVVVPYVAGRSTTQLLEEARYDRDPTR